MGRARQPSFFQMKDEAPFVFAGIWDEWKRDGVSIASCAIVTTAANALLEPIHDRMPVILTRESSERWLDPRAQPTELEQLLVPFPAHAMKSHPVGSNVNYPKIDNKDLIRRVDVERGDDSQSVLTGRLLARRPLFSVRVPCSQYFSFAFRP
jgi:putative SOS response-associated peptidase YedK